MAAYNLTYDAYTSNKKRDGYDLTKLNATQAHLITWLENDG